MPGGALYGDDWDRLHGSVHRVVDRFVRTTSAVTCINFVEVGIGLDEGTGKTTCDLMTEIRWSIPISACARWQYIGVDAFTADPNLDDPRFVFINEPSHMALRDLPLEIHWCFIDACHCYDCVLSDLINYSGRLVLGAEMCFHDASPLAQGKGPQDFYPGNYHDPETAAQGTAVRRVLDQIMPCRPDFRLVLRAPEDQPLGGVEIYEKVAIR